jgi:orotidine-5'-phosphate decarboxylase
VTDASPIVFALDFTSVDEAARAADRVKSAVGMLKVGLELFVAEGPRAVKLGEACGLPVFLDLKLHDIPETVERAVARAATLGVRVLTVHASGGPAMLARAVKRATSESAAGRDTNLAIAAVTVLTSLDVRDLQRMGIGTGMGTGANDDVASHAKRLARMAWEEGVRTFVCSAHEVAAMRAELGKDATLITPGIRPSADAGGDDQKRVATPAKATSDGADWLVVGRPIRDATDPLAIAMAMRDEARGAKRA